jgi:hypothetical protein
MQKATKLMFLADVCDKKDDLQPNIRLNCVRTHYAHAWGLSRLAGDYNGMRYCREKLEATGLSWDELAEQQQTGFGNAIANLWGMIENE